MLDFHFSSEIGPAAHSPGVLVVAGSFLSGIGVHSRNASLCGHTLHCPDAVIEQLHSSFQSGTANQLFATREDCDLHDTWTQQDRFVQFCGKWVALTSLHLRTWDALNKANQGGIAIFGAQVVAFAGYRGCFLGSFLLLLIRPFVCKKTKNRMESPVTPRKMTAKSFGTRSSCVRYAHLPGFHAQEGHHLQRPQGAKQC